MRPDPDSFNAGDTNLSRYCGNSPTNYTDPSGMVEDCGLGAFSLSDYLYYFHRPSKMDSDLQDWQGIVPWNGRSCRCHLDGRCFRWWNAIVNVGCVVEVGGQ